MVNWMLLVFFPKLQYQKKKNIRRKTNYRSLLLIGVRDWKKKLQQHWRRRSAERVCMSEAVCARAQANAQAIPYTFFQVVLTKTNA